MTQKKSSWVVYLTLAITLVLSGLALASSLGSDRTLLQEARADVVEIKENVKENREKVSKTRESVAAMKSDIKAIKETVDIIRDFLMKEKK